MAERTEQFARNQGLEGLLAELNGILGSAERAQRDLPDEPPFPIILIIGAPRSGTTLLMQWLAASGLVAYPSNLLSRFYEAPYIGARIQQLLCDPRFNYKDELSDVGGYGVPFTSDVGKTKGALQPNEFWYFWRRFIPNKDPDWITPEQENMIDGPGLRKGIAHIQHAFDLPFATKGIILQYNLEAVRKALGKVVFVHTKRHPFYNIQSLLKARMDYHGDLGTWFSVKPKEYEQLKDLDPITQVAGQVHYTQVGIDAQLASMDLKYSISMDHHAFCSDPKGFHDILRAKLALWGYDLPMAYSGPDRFSVHDKVRVDDAMRDRILAAYASLSGDELVLDQG